MITLADLRAACEGRGLFVYSGRGSTIWGLHDLFARTVVVCADDSPEFDSVDGTAFVNLEAITHIRTDEPPDAHLLPATVWEAAQSYLAHGNWVAMELRGAAPLADWAARFGVVAHTTPSALMARLNHKRTLQETLDSLGLPRVRGEWSRVGASTFGHWKNRFGRPVVVQAAVGEAGSGTMLAHDEADWERAGGRFGDNDVWIAPFLGDLSLNINAMAIPGASVAAHPNIQLTGFEFLNHAPGMYCGNDFAAAAMLPSALIADVIGQTVKVGDYLAGLGFRGLFGLDFVVSRDGVPHAVDLNPRWQGSTPLQGLAERRASRTPLSAVALLYAAGLIDRNEAVQASSESSVALKAAQVRMRWGPHSTRVERPPRPGIYSRDGRWKRPGTLLEQLTEEEVLLTGAPPRPGTRIEPGAQYFRIYTLESVLTAGTWTPSEEIRSLIGAIPGLEL